MAPADPAPEGTGAPLPDERSDLRRTLGDCLGELDATENALLEAGRLGKNANRLRDALVRQHRAVRYVERNIVDHKRRRAVPSNFDGQLVALYNATLTALQALDEYRASRTIAARDPLFRAVRQLQDAVDNALRALK